MANDVTLPGTGEPVATDEISGAHYQKMKLFSSVEDSTTGIDPLTDDELRATPVEVNLAVSTTQVGVKGDLAHDSGPDTGEPVKIGGKVSTGTPTPVADGNRTDAWFGTNGQLMVELAAAPEVDTNLDALVGGLTEAAPGTDTASSGLNGRLQRIAQRLTTLIGLVPAALTGSGNFKVAVQEALPAGTNAIGKLTANSGVDIGDVDVTSLPALPAGTNNIGDVDVLTLPALPTGTNNIGDVDVLTVPADPFGANADAIVAAGAAGSIQAKLRRLTQGVEDLKTAVVLAAGTNAIGKLAANSGVDIGDVDVTSVPTDPFGANADAASASGSVSAKLRAIATALGTTALDLGSGTGGTRTLRFFQDTAQFVGNSGNKDAATQRVVLATDQPALTNALLTTAAGDVAHGTGDSGNPVKVGFKARNAFPTAEANGDRVDGSADLFGRQLTSHIDPAQAVHKSFNATTTQTGADVWTPAGGKKIAVTSVVLSTYGTTGGRIILWFGDNADTTYTAGTDQLLLAFSAVPSATVKPGLVFTPAFPVFCTTADRELHITTDAGISVDIAIEGYEW